MIEGRSGATKSIFSYISAERKVRPIDPEEKLVLVVGIEIVNDGSLVLATDPLVADQKFSAGAQPHEDVIEISERDDVLETELK